MPEPLSSDRQSPLCAGAVALLTAPARFTRDREAVEVLGRATDLALAHQFDQAGFGELGDVVIGVAEGDLQLLAEIVGRENPAAVDSEDFQDRDTQRMGRRSR